MIIIIEIINVVVWTLQAITKIEYIIWRTPLVIKDRESMQLEYNNKASRTKEQSRNLHEFVPNKVPSQSNLVKNRPAKRSHSDRVGDQYIRSAISTTQITDKYNRKQTQYWYKTR